MELSFLDITLIMGIIISFVFSLWSFLNSLKVRRYFNVLSKDVDKGNLNDIIKTNIKKLESVEDQIDKIHMILNDMEKKSFSNLQKIRFKRFNPFHETGGDQSFILVLLDKNNDGVIISSLHQRDTTRLYAKSVANGSCKHKLSREEEITLNKAIDKK